MAPLVIPKFPGRFGFCEAREKIFTLPMSAMTDGGACLVISLSILSRTVCCGGWRFASLFDGRLILLGEVLSDTTIGVFAALHFYEPGGMPDDSTGLALKLSSLSVVAKGHWGPDGIFIKVGLGTRSCASRSSGGR